MIVIGTVISLNLKAKVKKNGGGFYDGWELIYKSSEGEVKTIAKPIQSLKFNKKLENGLSSLAAGDDFTMELEKNAGGFWDAKSVQKGIVEVEAPAAPARPTVAGNAAPARAGGTYETPEERQAKQRYIIRQSSLSNAIEVLTTGAKAPPDLDAVFDLAEAFTNWVYEKKDGPDLFEDLTSDIPD